ncbi:hypothetical protein [Photobacterium kishitanii]|uniref:hypothetical protein n=1 Tax=Photobacterium kishitanii TaxID=318456 RepID=UPI0007F91BC0|nr:hypothetical protein [Photobacterium kishitanii]OBU31456.1 hypothetical protein AYY23_19540 [Photobacterium kishitanii]
MEFFNIAAKMHQKAKSTSIPEKFNEYRSLEIQYANLGYNQLSNQLQSFDAHRNSATIDHAIRNKYHSYAIIFDVAYKTLTITSQNEYKLTHECIHYYQQLFLYEATNNKYEYDFFGIDVQLLREFWITNIIEQLTFDGFTEIREIMIRINEIEQYVVLESRYQAFRRILQYFDSSIMHTAVVLPFFASNKKKCSL